MLSVRDSAEPAVALGSRLAAELYGCRVLVADVEDHPDNATRFVWLAPAAEAGEPGVGGKTSLVFWGGGDQSPGWLVHALREFADRGVNLTRIESRPRRTSLGHYMFFVDLEGGAGDPLVAEALAALRGAGRGAAGSRLVHRLRAGRPAKLGGVVAVSTHRMRRSRGG